MSIDENIIQKVTKIAKKKKRKYLFFLDNNFTHNHVLSELKAYAPLVNRSSYFIVKDMGIEDFPKGAALNRRWIKRNNPKITV